MILEVSLDWLTLLPSACGGAIHHGGITQNKAAGFMTQETKA